METRRNRTQNLRLILSHSFRVNELAPVLTNSGVRNINVESTNLQAQELKKEVNNAELPREQQGKRILLFIYNGKQLHPNCLIKYFAVAPWDDPDFIFEEKESSATPNTLDGCKMVHRLKQEKHILHSNTHFLFGKGYVVLVKAKPKDEDIKANEEGKQSGKDPEGPRINKEITYDSVHLVTDKRKAPKTDESDKSEPENVNIKKSNESQNKTSDSVMLPKEEVEEWEQFKESAFSEQFGEFKAEEVSLVDRVEEI
eukprot:Gb_26736 [translate_table: standard]